MKTASPIPAHLPPATDHLPLPFGIFSSQNPSNVSLLCNEKKSCPSLAEKAHCFARMELRQAVFSIYLLLFPLVIMAQATSPCSTDYFLGCFSTAIVSACGDLTSSSCICGSSGQVSIASLVGSCLFASCPVTQILAIGNLATSVCNAWLSTHTLTPTAGGLGSATGSAVGPASTTFSSVTTTSPSYLTITSSPSLPTSLPTSTSTGTASQGLPVGADVGVGVGALAIVCVVAVLAFFCLRRRRRAKKETSPEAHELQTGVNISELPDKSDGLEEVHVVKIPLHELEGFQFPFQQQMAPVEADSQSVRAQSRGRVAGTETTAFDFESQKVLITPELRDQSRGSSRGPASSPASIRRHNMDT